MRITSWLTKSAVMSPNSPMVIYVDMLENFARPQLGKLQPNVMFQHRDTPPPHGVCLIVIV